MLMQLDAREEDEMKLQDIRVQHRNVLVDYAYVRAGKYKAAMNYFMLLIEHIEELRELADTCHDMVLDFRDRKTVDEYCETIEKQLIQMNMIEEEEP